MRGEKRSKTGSRKRTVCLFRMASRDTFAWQRSMAVCESFYDIQHDNPPSKKDHHSKLSFPPSLLRKASATKNQSSQSAPQRATRRSSFDEPFSELNRLDFFENAIGVRFSSCYNPRTKDEKTPHQARSTPRSQRRSFKTPLNK